MACVLGDDGVDIEVEGIVDVLVGGAERDAESFEQVLQMRSSSNASRPSRSARTTQTWEKRPTRASRDKRAASRSLSSQRDSTRDAVILVMLEDQNTRFGRETAVEGGALVADGMAVALLVGGDAGVGGYGAGVGQDDLQEKGKRSAMYERSEGASRSRRIGVPIEWESTERHRSTQKAGRRADGRETRMR